MKIVGSLFVFFGLAPCLAVPKTVYFDVQDSKNRNLLVKVCGEQLRLKKGTNEVDSLQLEKPKFSVSLKRDQFSVQNVLIKTGNTILAKICISRSHSDSPPLVRLRRPLDVCAVLYRACMGGGNRFVLAIGDTKDEVSVEAVKSQQTQGRLEKYTAVDSVVDDGI